jgi:hypothetical protein
MARVSEQRRKRMPQIVITADGLESRDGQEVLRERVAASDLESEHFAAHLVERIEWAVEDAHSLEARRQRRQLPRKAGDRRSRQAPAA